MQCRTGSAETLHFVHSSVLGGHFSNLFPVRLLDPQNTHLGLEKNTTSGSPTLLLGLFRCQILVVLYSIRAIIHQALNHVKM